MDVPASALIVLIGVAGSGKSSFARNHFQSTEILSSDFFRGLVSDDEADQEASHDAFDLLHAVLDRRLSRGKLCVVDATNLREVFRARLIERAQHFGRPAIAFVFDRPEDVCIERAGKRAERPVSADVIRHQLAELRAGLPGLPNEGFARVVQIDDAAPVQIRRL